MNRIFGARGDQSARRVTGRELPIDFAALRSGDPPELAANTIRLRREFGWSPRFICLDDIIATAWSWFRNRPEGYRSPGAPSHGEPA
jgi:UDP-glucose 4-epimerase